LNSYSETRELAAFTLHVERVCTDTISVKYALQSRWFDHLGRCAHLACMWPPWVQPRLSFLHSSFVTKFSQEVFEKTWATKTSLRKNTLIIKRTPKVVLAPPPSSAPAPASPPGEAPSTSKPVEVNKAMSVTPGPESTIQEPPLLSQEELADLPIERLIQLTESRMKIWTGPSSEGWMPAPRVSILHATSLNRANISRLTSV
jgi:hypothetical protein